MKEIDDILDEMRKHAGPKQLPHYRRLITGFVYRLEPLIRQLEADRDNWRRQALDEDARANAINSAANANVDAKVYSKSEVIEVLNKVHDFLGILIRENLIKEAPYLDEEPMLKVSDLADDLWEVIHKKLPCNNAAKIYTALEAVYECAKDGVLTIRESAFEKVLEALKEPLRNCDVYTMAEQSKRHEEYCKSHSTNGRCVKCPLWQMRLLGLNCAIAWANLPSDALEDNKEIANEES